MHEQKRLSAGLVAVALCSGSVAALPAMAQLAQPASTQSSAQPASTQPSAQAAGTQLYPNNLVVTRTVYDNKPGNVKVGTILPPNCAATLGECSATTGAPYDGTYPYVFNNDLYDGSFGITSKIYLDQSSLTGTAVNSMEVPNIGPHGNGKHIATSFSSKSELALNLSSDGKYLTFMGYVAPI